MAVKSKSKKPAGKAAQQQQKQVKPAKKQRPQEPEEEEDEDDSEEEPSFTHPKAGKLTKVKQEPTEDSDEEEDDDEEEEDDDEEVEGEAEEEEDDSEEEEAPVEKPSKPVKRKAEVVVKQEPSEENDDNKNTVFVSHIFNVKNEVLTEYFAKAGEIAAIRNIARKGYAFIRFANDESVENALKMDGQEWNGKNIIVQRAKAKKSDAKKRRAEKRKAEGEPQAKKPKDGGKVVNLKKGNFKGKPKTPQKPNPNKKQNKPKSGAFVKAK